MKRIVVTGGAGLIGSHLCERLLAMGSSVVCVDNFCTSTRKNIQQFLGNKNFELIEHNIVQPLEIKGSVDELYNLASPSTPAALKTMPLHIALTNTQGVLNMAQLAVEKKAVFFQASTSEVYGNPLQHPQRETYWGNANPIGERSCYDEGKRFAESLLLAFHDKKGLDVRIARFFNTYGPKQIASDGRVIPNFVTQALRNKPLTVYGDGKQTRSFCYITDLLDAMLKLMRCDYVLPVNLGNPDEVTIIELANLVREMSNSSSKIVFKPLPEDDPARRMPDISLAKRLLNWEPKVTLKEGMRHVIDWFSSHPDY